MERYLQVSEDQLKTVVVDSRMRSHVLTKDDEIIVIFIEPNAILNSILKSKIDFRLNFELKNRFLSSKLSQKLIFNSIL